MSGGARRIAVLLEYDGTAYRGSQYQENGPSIQSELEAAINNLTAESVRVAFAGRTDAGVHALGQVAAFRTASALPEADFRSGLNHFLSEDIVVREAKVAAMTFDPRRDAVSRAYRYRIANRKPRPVLERKRCWHVPRPLNIAAIQSVAASLVGEHNFAAFASPYDGLTVRTLRRCEVNCGEDGEIAIEVEAKAFLPHQVRRMVGAMVEVSLGRMKQEELVALLEAARPSSAGPAAPAHGLFLVAVRYEGFAFGHE
jgi:tRNA pseudouridine38-40 synthase